MKVYNLKIGYYEKLPRYSVREKEVNLNVKNPLYICKSKEEVFDRIDN